MSEERIDILNRDKFVEDVFTVIETLSANRKSCTFAINGEWGSGKSFVLDMLEEKLTVQQSEETAYDKYAVFHYNCWKYDYYDEPLYAIVSAMYDWAKSNEDQLANKAKNILLYTMIAFGLVAEEATNNVIKCLTDIDAIAVKEKTKAKVEKIKNKGKLDDELFTVQESIEFTRDLLAVIAQEQTVVIVVDELDRCLPEYAIKVLERLHHLFDDIENLIVVLAVDKERLNNTVSQIFGFNKDNNNNTTTINVNSYLAKFIDFEINLDKGIVDENYKTKYSEYFSKFISDNDSAGVTELVSALLDGFDARKRDKIFQKALLIHNLVFDEQVEISVMIVELLFVVYSLIPFNNRFINKSTFLIDNTSQFLPRFAEIFKNQVVEHTRLGIKHNPWSEEVVGYGGICENNIRHQIIFYIICYPNCKLDFFVQDDNDEQFIKNGERIKEFYKLLDIIN